MNSFGGIGGWEFVLLVIIVMIVLGPERMVKHAFQAGKWARHFRRFWKESAGVFKEQLHDLETDARDGIDLPNMEDIKDLDAELRLVDQIDPNPEQAKNDTQGSDSSQTADRSSGDSTSYSAWVASNKPRR